MKNNTFKRVLAGSLALLSVAAYMPANVVVELGANGAALTAVAASKSTVSWDDAISEYIASISDGDTTTENNVIKLTDNLKFNENAVLTIVSSIPLNLYKNGNGLVSVEDTVDLTTKNGDTYTYENNYIVTESNGTYTYKVLNSKSLSFEGVDAPVAFINASGEVLTLADQNTVETTQVEDDAKITVNEEALEDVDSTYAQKTVLKITGKKAFEVYVKHNSVDAIEQYVAAYDTATGLFVANAIVPVTATGETVQVYFNKVVPNYTYKNKGTELTATLDGTQVTAASISATYQNKVKTTKQERQSGVYKDQLYKYDTVTNLANGGTVANASRVELTFTNDTTGEITSQSADDTPVNYSLKITRDGEEIVDTESVYADAGVIPGVGALLGSNYEYVKSSSTDVVPGEAYDKDDTDGLGVLSFTKTGTYVVEYTVYTRVKNTSGKLVLTPETLKYQFTINAKEALTAENVQLTASGTNLKTTDSQFAVTDGVVEFEVTEDWTTANVIDVEAALFGDPDDEQSALPNGAIVSITGTSASSILNNVNTMTITYNNSEYGTADKTVTVKWKLVEAKKEIVVKENEIYQSENYGVTFDSTPYFKTTIDNLDTIEEDIYAALTIENAEPSAVTFEYVEGFGANADSEELYYHEDGLPTAKGEYSVFAMYEGEIVAAFNVEIAEHALYAAPTAEQLSYTYGTKKLSSDDLKFEDIDGKVVEDAGVKNAFILYFEGRELTTVESKKIVDGKFNNQDVFVVDGKNYIADKYYDDEDIDYLDAGVYIVYVAGIAGDTTVAKEGYAVQPSTFAVKVAQKKITSDMVTFAAQTYTGKSITPTVGDVTVKDTAVKVNGAPVDITVKIADNTTSASAVGEYTVNVQVDEEASPNYTGKAAAKWHIVKEATNESMTGLAFVDKYTTIYNNGQIHFEVNRPDDTQFQNGVAKFGVVYEKNGKLAAPEKEMTNEGLKYPKFAKDAKDQSAFEAATAALQVGNGYGEGNQSDKLRAKNPTKYGANLNVVDVETGAWLRPYVVDGKGNIYYGDVVYVNLVQEATEALNLKLANFNYDSQTTVVTKDEAKEDQSAEALANKTWRNEVQIGYSTQKNSYYVYGSYTLAKDSNVKSDAVQGFGVVVDKKGAVDYFDYEPVINQLNARNAALSNLDAAPSTGNNNTDYDSKFTWLRSAFVAYGFDKDSDLVKALDTVSGNTNPTNRSALLAAYNEAFGTTVTYTDAGNSSYTNWTATSTSSNRLANALITSMKTKLTEAKNILVDAIDKAYKDDAEQYVTAADKLKLGNGFIEGKSGSNKMDIDEYGALITPYNTVTGVWVRAYVDLGNNLVVYTDPIYIKDISSIYNQFDSNVGITSAIGESYETADELAVGEMNYIDALEKQRVEFMPTADDELATAGAKLKNAGVVVDKSGSFLTKENGVFLPIFEDIREVRANLILGNGYVQGKKPNTGNMVYAANITQETYRVTEAAGLTNIPLVVRPYAIYEINKKDVVVYGAPRVSYVNEATEKEPVDLDNHEDWV